MTAAPGSTRVVASHALVMCRTSSSHDQPDGVPLAVGRYVHRVDHVADEEQSPAAGALVAVELLDEIGLLGSRARLGSVDLAALVGDRHDDLVAVLGHLDLDRDLRAVAVAVLDRVHGGLGDRGLQPLELLGVQSEALHGPGDPVQRQALVAGLAGQGERVEPAGLFRCMPCGLSHGSPPRWLPCSLSVPAMWSAWCQADGERCSDTSVMSSSCSWS